MGPPSNKIIFTPEAPKPLGPYSQGVMAGGTLYISGQLGIDPETSNFVGNSADVQCRQALKNIGGILKAAGGNFEHVVKTTVLLANIADWPAVNSVYAECYLSEELSCSICFPSWRIAKGTGIVRVLELTFCRLHIPKMVRRK
ncbi:hypothetical protein M514_04936 [Trichuris suis]|uniref:Uncharacterized protein n=1 Tax=Trichuris suis TaxID=68888 RepID=A0A085NP22_9BILA|nr:hypothetical protein M514_04936 [Trichuris suis]